MEKAFANRRWVFGDISSKIGEFEAESMISLENMDEKY